MSDQGQQPEDDGGGRYPHAGGVPMKDWVTERPFDSADYLDREPPRYQTGKAADAAAGAAAKAIKRKDKADGTS